MGLITYAWLVTAVGFCLLALVRTIYILLATPIAHISCLESSEGPKVSILLPVRNEADRVLRRNLRSLITQNYDHFEVIAVEDNSTDDSLSILREAEQNAGGKLRVIKGEPPPNDWLGKLFSLHQAKHSANGEWLLLADADIIYSEKAVESALRFAIENHLDALSLLPRAKMWTFWEQVLIPVMAWLSLMRVSTTQANRQRSRACFGYGNFILLRRAAHNSIGGFETYKGDILDDCATMEHLKRCGYRVMVADGAELLQARVYSSLGEMLKGFGKNAFPALRFSHARLLGVVLMEILFIFLPLAYWFWQLLTEYIRLSPKVLLPGLAVAFFFSTMLAFGLRMRGNWKFFVLYPVGHIAAIVILVYSMLIYTLRRGGRWKDRVVRGFANQ